MNIGRTDGIGGPGRVDGPNQIARVQSPATPASASSADKVDLSHKAAMISKALSLPQVRAERVAEVRKLIESGRFDTETRLEGALKRFVVENPEV